MNKNMADEILQKSRVAWLNTLIKKVGIELQFNVDKGRIASTSISKVFRGKGWGGERSCSSFELVRGDYTKLIDFLKEHGFPYDDPITRYGRAYETDRGYGKKENTFERTDDCHIAIDMGAKKYEDALEHLRDAVAFNSAQASDDGKGIMGRLAKQIQVLDAERDELYGRIKEEYTTELRTRLRRESDILAQRQAALEKGLQQVDRISNSPRGKGRSS